MRSPTWLRPEKSQSIVRGQGFESPHLHDIPCGGIDTREVQLPGGFGSRTSLLLRVSYALGHLSVVVVFEDDADVDAEDDAFADGFALAA